MNLKSKMFNNSLLIIIIIILITINVLQCEDPNKTVYVNTKLGKMKGVSNDFHNHSVSSFLGIRYGQPPIGDFRFAKPRPVMPWTGVYDATKTGNMCMQKFLTSGTSEDCLFLNVYTPIDFNHDPHDHSSDDHSANITLLPVMFWIHGGGFVQGSGNVNGAPLSIYDVVVVSFNYRLGTFGFLYGGSDAAPGNVGLWDQTLALKWVIN
jgi:carboxylesterase type B